jgi:hypothetical protein
MWDLAEDPNSIKLIESFLAAGECESRYPGERGGT